MKQCLKCNTEKLFTDFFKDKNKPNGISSTCKQCQSSKRKTEEFKAKRRESRPKIKTQKECLWCNNQFELHHKAGQRDRKFCDVCEEHHIKQFGTPLSKIVGTAVSHAKDRAKEQNLPFDITTEYIYTVIPKDGLCPILEIPMTVNTRYTISIDKIVPEKGYTKENTQVISLKANQMKNDATNAELHKFSNYIQRNIK